MNQPLIARLEQMLANGQDSAMLRFGLGQAYLQADQPDLAIKHFQQCVTLDSNYSAAWKLLGKTWVQLGDRENALTTLNQGIAIAEAKGDKQALKEMAVYLKRAQKLP